MLGIGPKLLVDYFLGAYRYVHDKPPKDQAELINLAGHFTYTSNPDGSIKILGNWPINNIVTTQLAITKQDGTPWKIQVHKHLQKNLSSLFVEYAYCGLQQTYPIIQLGGWVARHKMWNPKSGLSIHSYGFAVDINWDQNKVGTIGTIPSDIVTLFKQYGWNWGGWWRRPKDPMHFEFFG